MNKKRIYNNTKLILINEVFLRFTIGLNISKLIRNSVSFSYSLYIFSEIIGHLLGNGNLILTWFSKNP